MSCTDHLRLASLLFMLALTGDPGLLRELVDAVVSPRIPAFATTDGDA